MNPLSKAKLASTIRFAGGGIVGILIALGLMKPGQIDTKGIIEGIIAVVTAIVTLRSAFNKNTETHELTAALAGKARTTVAKTKAEIKARIITADPTTPEHDVPLVGASSHAAAFSALKPLPAASDVLTFSDPYSALAREVVILATESVRFEHAKFDKLSDTEQRKYASDQNTVAQAAFGWIPDLINWFKSLKPAPPVDPPTQPKG